MLNVEGKAELIKQCDHVNAEDIVDTALLLGLSAKSKSLSSDMVIHDMLRKGLPVKAVRELIKNTGVNLEELSIATSIPEHTLLTLSSEMNRGTRLIPQYSDAFWKFAAVFVKAKKLMGSAELAKQWLCSNALALQHRKPIEVLSSSPGMSLVIRVLHQLEHGVYV